MNVLVIGHTYITDIGREKWHELVRAYGVTLRIVTPDIWKDYLFTIRAADHPDPVLDMRPLPVVFSGKEAAHWYPRMDKAFRGFRPDILHVEEGSDALSYAQALFCRRVFAPKAKSIFFTWMNFEKRLRFPFGVIERWNLRRSDAAICGNSDAGEILRGKGFRNPIHVLPLLGIDPERFSARRDPELRASLGLRGVVIGFIGRFVPEKGVLDLINAASTLQEECTVLFIGGGTAEVEMRALAAEKGMSGRVTIVPSVPHADIPRYLNVMDILALPSYAVPHWKEQFGQVLVQAMACEVPVIGSTHAEIPRVISDAGLIFGERHTEELREALARLAASPELRKTFAVKGRARVLGLYTNEKIGARTMEVYRQVLNL